MSLIQFLNKYLLSVCDLYGWLNHQIKKISTMSSHNFICCPIFLLIMNCSLSGQSRDTITAQKIIDKGSKGDIILGEKNKKEQLNNPPVSLHAKDSVCRSDARSSKKLRKKQNKKGS